MKRRKNRNICIITYIKPDEIINNNIFKYTLPLI